jgi:hypothetical protein
MNEPGDEATLDPFKLVDESEVFEISPFEMAMITYSPTTAVTSAYSQATVDPFKPADLNESQILRESPLDMAVLTSSPTTAVTTAYSQATVDPFKPHLNESHVLKEPPL